MPRAALIFLLTGLLFGQFPHAAGQLPDRAQPARADSTTTRTIEPAAERLLRAASAQYQGLSGWHADMLTGWRMEDPQYGQRFVRTTTTLDLLRPDRLKIVRQGEQAGVWVANGTTVTIFMLRTNSYVQFPQNRPLDQLLLAPDAGLDFLTSGAVYYLAALLSPNPYAALTTSVTRVRYAGPTSFRNEVSELLILERPGGDLRLFLAPQAPHWVLRFLPDPVAQPIPGEPGSAPGPMFFGRFTLRNQHTSVSPVEFEYAPPRNARRATHPLARPAGSP